MSRAFGNRLLKPFVVAEPEIQVLFCFFLRNSGGTNFPTFTVCLN